jgi:hypothetical protein
MARTWTDRLNHFDRRWIFVIMGLALVVPFIWPLRLPIRVSAKVKAAYYAVEDLKPGDVVFVGLDFDPASKPEMKPFLRAVLLQLKRKDVKLVFATTWYSAPTLMERYIHEMVDQPIVHAGDGYTGKPDRAYVRNVDYVWLGFREGREAVIASLGKDVWGTFDGRANDGTPLAQIPMMQGRKALADFNLLVLVSAGYPGSKEYVQLVQSRYHLKMITSCTAVSLTDLAPYYDAGQLLGLVGGMGGAAEYEQMVGRPDDGAQGADALNTGYLVVITAIVLGNLIYFAGRRRGGRRA